MIHTEIYVRTRGSRGEYHHACQVLLKDEPTKGAFIQLPTKFRKGSWTDVEIERVAQTAAGYMVYGLYRVPYVGDQSGMPILEAEVPEVSHG